MRIRSVLTHSAQALAEGSLIALLVVGLMAGSVFAAKGGGQSGSWIELAQGSGFSASVQPTLGDSVSFSTGYPNNVQNPRIEVLCYQNGSLVYGAAGAVTDSFLLGGGGSIWLTNGGSATCTANLFYFGQHAGSQTYNVLASTTPFGG
jgi:hypothetical protein